MGLIVFKHLAIFLTLHLLITLKKLRSDIALDEIPHMKPSILYHCPDDPAGLQLTI